MRNSQRLAEGRPQQTNFDVDLLSDTLRRKIRPLLLYGRYTEPTERLSVSSHEVLRNTALSDGVKLVELFKAAKFFREQHGRERKTLCSFADKFQWGRRPITGFST